MAAGVILMGQIVGAILRLRRPIRGIDVSYLAVGPTTVVLGATVSARLPGA